MADPTEADKTISYSSRGNTRWVILKGSRGRAFDRALVRYLGFSFITWQYAKAADAIIVLTGGQSRLDAAMDILASGKGERLLISGVHPSATKRQLQVAMGGNKQLFSCCVDIDRAALDTIGNAEESAKWVENHAYGSIIIVTNNYHMPRSLLEMGRLLHGARLEPYPVVNTNLGNGNWLTKPEALRVLLTEYSKYVLSLARGFLPLRTPEGVTLAEASTVVKN